MSSSSFSSVPLRHELLSRLSSLGLSSMTPIQQHSLPSVLEGHDVIAQGQTGSGKTAAFALGLLNKIHAETQAVQALVLCPTRELADQVSQAIRQLATNIPNIKLITLCGGSPVKRQAEALANGMHIVVGTPGRIQDHLTRESLSLEALDMLVLDEADRMLDMGFQKELEAIISKTPGDRQTLLFSATYPETIEAIASKVMRNAKHIAIQSEQAELSIDVACFEVNADSQRLEAARLLLLDEYSTFHAQAGSGGHQPQTIVFCNTRDQVKKVVAYLRQHQFSVAALQGEMDQKERDQALVRFSNGSLLILVATDIAARGLDVKSLDLVINYDLPKDSDTYTHRIGRTGRAGESGKAYSLHGRDEVFRLEAIYDAIPSQRLPAKSLLSQKPIQANKMTLRIGGGRKHKLRPGDVVGALTKGEEISGAQVGKIQVMEQWAYVAVESSMAKIAASKIGSGKIKGKSFRCQLLVDE